MKQPDYNPPSGQNWSWPQKTWFQERLNAVKGREQQAQRKPPEIPKDPIRVEAKSIDEKVPEKE